VFALTEDRKPLPIAAALVGKVGYRFVEKNRPPVAKDIGSYWDAKNLVAHSMTGELTWDAMKGYVRINTPRTQAVIGFLSAEPHAFSTSTITSATRFGAVWVTAMDGDAPIRTARHLLVTAVGPARNTGMEYGTTQQLSRLGAPLQHLKAEGGAPALLEAVTGDIQIRCDHPEAFKCWSLDVVGKRKGEVHLQTHNSTVQLRLSHEHQAVYYELSAE
jgi:hypothetical protein